MPVYRTSSDAPRRSLRLSNQDPVTYDKDGFPSLVETDGRYSSESSESSSSYHREQSPFFTNPFATASVINDVPNDPSTSHSRRNAGRIPRPPNAFILFRSDCCKARAPGSDECETSRLAGMAWRTLPQEVKDRYEQLALIKKAQHAELYPGYKYTPGKKAAAKAKRPAKDKDIRSSARTTRTRPRAPVRAVTPPSPTSTEHTSIKREETQTPQLSLFASAPTPRSYTPVAASQLFATEVDNTYTYISNTVQYGDDYLVYPEEASTYAPEPFVPTKDIPLLDLNATGPQPPSQCQFETLNPEVKIESPEPVLPPSPSLPSHTEIDIAFGVKPMICSMQLEPSQVLLTDSNGYPEVTSYANDLSFTNSSFVESSSFDLNWREGLHYDYSLPSYDTGHQQDWSLEATMDQLCGPGPMYNAHNF